MENYTNKIEQNREINNNNNEIYSETIINIYHHLICKYYYILEANYKLDEIIKNEENNSDLFNTIQKIIELNKEFCFDFNKNNNKRIDFFKNIESNIEIKKPNYYLAIQCDITSDIRKEEKKFFSFIHYKKLSKFLRNLHYSITQDQWDNINDVNTKHLFLSNNNLYGEKTKNYFLNFLEKGYIQENLKWLNLNVNNIQLHKFNEKLDSIIQSKINQYLENTSKYYNMYSLKIIKYITNHNN
jgi:hypothetical protein